MFRKENLEFRNLTFLPDLRLDMKWSPSNSTSQMTNKNIRAIFAYGDLIWPDADLHLYLASKNIPKENETSFRP